MRRPCLRSALLLLVTLLPAAAYAQVVMAPGGGEPVIRVLNPDGSVSSFLAYDPTFTGGVRVALGDVNGDGIVDIITGAGPTGGPHVKVFSGADLSLLASFFAYDPAFTGGIFVAAGDVNGDGRADIITGAGPGGGPHVRVFSGADLSELASFYAYDPGFTGGIFVAAGDVNGDGSADIITGAGPGGGPHVRVFSGADLSELASFYAYDPFFPGGVSVASLDLNGDGLADIVTGAGAGGGPHVRVFSGADLSDLASFYAYDPLFTGGVSVGAADFDGDGQPELVTGAGPGGGPHVRVFRTSDFAELGSFFAFDPSFTGGVFIGSLPGAGAGLRFTSASSTSFTVGSAGTFSITTAGGSGAVTVTETGSLPGGVTFTDNGDGTATLAGTPAAGTGGTYALNLTADNGGPTPATQTFTLTVTGAPAITSAAATTFPINAPGTFAVTTTGFPIPTITRTGAALPAGVTWVDNGDGTGTLGGTAAAGTGGTYVLTFTASNGVGAPAVQTFTLSVNGAPGFTSANSTTFTVGSLGTFTVTTVGSPTAAISVTGALPTGVTFTDNGNGTGTLSGTPAAGTGGTRTLTFTATNGIVPNGSQTFTLNVNQAPAITSAAATGLTVGTAGSFTVTTTGFPVPTIVRSGAALPAGVTFTDNGDGTGTLSGTPAAGTNGTYALIFTATSGGPAAVQNFTLTVSAGPAITSAATATFTLNTAGTTFQVVMTGIPAPTVSVTAGVLPTGLTLSSAGLLSGTPTQSGSFPVTLTATNGTLPNATQAFTVLVNAAPAITSAAATTFTVGSAGSFNVVMTGFPAPTVSVTAGTLPAGVTLSPAGILSGTPDPGTGGVHNVTFTATNGIGANAVQAFTLTVNGPPSITSANTTTFTVGAAGTFTVTTTGFPTPTITRTGVAPPAGVTFVDNGNGTGTLSGTPAAGAAGAYAFTFTAANGVTPDGTQSFTLNVSQPPAITSGNTDTFTVGTADSFTVTTTGFPAPTVSQTGALPVGVMFTPATRVLGGTATQTGVFPLVFTAANGIPPDATQNFTLNVVCPAITVNPATMTDGLYQVAYAGVTFTQTGSTGSSFTWSAIGLPAGLTISATTGVVSGTPTNTVLNGAVSVTATDNFGCTGTRNTTITVRPSTDNENYIGGVGNTQYVVGVSPVPSTPHVLNLDANQVNVKIGDNGPAPLFVTFPATSTNGGTIVEGTTDGTFIYTPALNFGGPSDTFTYTLTDANGVTNTGTVTINLSNLVWYVNSSGGNGDGRSHNPFNTLASASTASGANSYIFVHSGGATTPGNLTMDVGQILRGQGGSIPFTLNGLTIATGLAPTLTGTVTLGNATQVVAVNFTPTAIPAIVANATTAVTIDTVNVTGGTNALSLTNATGVVNVTNSSFTNSTGAEVLISGGTANVNIGATISSNAGRSIDIQNRTAGTVSFTGAITDTGQGILLNANTGSTINFSGGLSLSTTTNPAFTATAGGAVSATQNNTTIVNTITTTTGTALNVTNTALGASGITFRSISANGAPSGIVLNNTGASGALTLTGNGVTTVGGDNSGGTIQNTTNAGILLTNTQSPSFTNLNIQNIGRNGIDGTGVTNFTFNNGTITNTGTAGAGQFDEALIGFNDSVSFTENNVSGNVTITGNVLSQPRRNGIDIQNWAGTISNVVISGNTISGGTTTSTIQHGILVMSQGSAATTGHITTGAIQNNNISGFSFLSGGIFTGGSGIFVAGGSGNASNATTSTLGTAANPIEISGNDVDNVGSNGIAVSFNGQNGISHFNIHNNGSAVDPMSNMEGLGISVFFGGSGTFSALVTNNAIDNNGPTVNAGSAGIGVQLDDGPAGLGNATGVAAITVNGNLVTNPDGFGIRGIARASNGTLNLKTQNNVVGIPSAANRNAIRIDSGSAIGNTTLCLNMTGNTGVGGGNLTGSGVNAGIGVRKQGTVPNVNFFGIDGITANPTNAQVQAFLTGLNPTTGVDIISGSGYMTCSLP